jgi:FkbM family methyltransferase
MRKWEKINNLGGIKGFSPYLLLDSSKYLDKSIKDTGIFEDNLSRFVRNYVTKDMVCIDIGANIGYYTMILGSCCNSVIAFEPVQQYFNVVNEEIIKNKDILGDIICHRLGASNNPSKTDISVGVCSATIHWVAKGISASTEQIQLIKLDDFLEVERLDLIKIDCDGHDLLVITGAKNLILKYKPVIVMEVAPTHYKKAGVSILHLWDYLTGLNYSIRNENNPNKAITYQSLQKLCDSLNNEASFNIICTPNNSIGE